LKKLNIKYDFKIKSQNYTSPGLQHTMNYVQKLLYQLFRAVIVGQPIPLASLATLHHLLYLWLEKVITIGIGSTLLIFGSEGSGLQSR